jgi:AcrR family transcriptional regulator
MVEPVEVNRKEKILDAAEKAIAELGFEGASLRHIVLDANVNLATVYYYFGSKERLMEEVFKRRFGPMKEEQILRVEQLMAKSELPTVEQVLEAMLVPVLQFTMGCGATNQIAIQLIGRIVTEPKPEAQELIRCQHSPVRDAYFKAFQKILPHLAPQDLQWRLEFIWGSLGFIMCNPCRVYRVTEGLCDTKDTTKMLQQMVLYFSAGLRAAAAPANS